MKKTLTIIIALAACLFPINMAHGQTQRQFTGKVFHSSHGQDLPYRVMFPEDFDPSKSYPLILFLHGAGERGTDNNSQLVHGRARFQSDSSLKNTIVLAPQCPKEDYWVCIVKTNNPSEHRNRTFPYSAPISSSMTSVKELLDAMVAVGFVDTNKIYGIGISMGAMGVLDLAFRFPNLFRAVEPMCGGINNNRVEEFKGKTAFRFFQGLRDDIVLPKFAQENSKALKKAGVEAVIVEYPQDNHNCWDSAFLEPDLFTWMFNQTQTNEK